MVVEKKDIKGYLKELRKLFFVPFIVAISVFVLAVMFLPQVLPHFIQYLGIDGVSLLNPTEAYSSLFSIAGILAFVFSLPLVIDATYSFLKPVWDKNYDKIIRKELIITGFASAFGFGFGLFVFSKIMLMFISHITLGATPMWSLYSVVMFIFTMSTVLSLSSLLCVFLPLLAKTGILSKAATQRLRLPFFVGSPILGAILTPSDVFSQLVVAGFIYGGFEIGVWRSRKCLA